MLKRYTYYCFVFFVVTAFCGCGNGHLKGSGTVTYSTGEPIPQGMVFFSTPQFNYTGMIKDGVFELGGLKEGDGLPPGRYRVHFIGTETSGEDTMTERPLFAEKYRSSATSGIECEVKSGEKNRFDFVVEKPKESVKTYTHDTVPGFRQ